MNPIYILENDPSSGPGMSDSIVLRRGPAPFTYDCTECKSLIQPALAEYVEEKTLPDPALNASNRIFGRGSRILEITLTVHFCPVCNQKNIIKTTTVEQPEGYCIFV